jgi:23S rRNA (cytidine1920-2'-O)/16S rRNA (cytidine1409-2'-O)-methyltransferase
VIRDPAIHRQVLIDVLNYTLQQGYEIHGLIRSPLTGPKGNTEFMVWLEYPGKQTDSLEGFIDSVFSEIS